MSTNAATPAPAKGKATAKKASADDALDKLPAPKRKVPPVATLPTVAGPKGWGSADDTFDHVTAVRTIFPDFNRATRVGGLPTSRITTIHGPTHGGKSAFELGLLRSFVDNDDYAALVDAEHTTGKKFAQEMMGRPLKEIPNFLGNRPKTYEETIEKVDEFLEWIAGMRRGKKVAGKWEVEPRPELACAIAIDSINKLVPERELEQLRKDADNIDKGWGRVRANLNQAWLDHLVPMLGDANCAMIFIAQERKDEDLDPWQIPTIKGGGALRFDASLICRIMKSYPIRDGAKDDKAAPIIGFAHKIRIWKSKVGPMDGFATDCVFHVSNGNLIPPGFDTARDAITVALGYGMIETSGSWLSWNRRRWQGERKMHLELAREPELLAELMMAINARIDADLVKGMRGNG